MKNTAPAALVACALDVVFRARDVQLRDRGEVRDGAGGLGSPDDRQRHHDAARPRGHLVDVEDPEVVGQQQDLGRHGGSVVPRALSEDREINPREGVAGLDAAVRQDRLAGPDHVGRLRVVAHELQDEVGLDRGADFRRPALVDGPAAGRQLLAAQVFGGLLRRDLRPSGRESASSGRTRTPGWCRPRARRPSGRPRPGWRGGSAWPLRRRFRRRFGFCRSGRCQAPSPNHFGLTYSSTLDVLVVEIGRVPHHQSRNRPCSAQTYESIP